MQPNYKPVVETTRKKSRTDIIRRRLNQAFSAHPGTTSKALADHCGVTEQAVYKWRRFGKISRDNVPQAAAFFGERPNWLLDDLTELREPDADSYDNLSRSEKTLLEAMRRLPSEVMPELERHIAALGRLFAKVK